MNRSFASVKLLLALLLIVLNLSALLLDAADENNNDKDRDDDRAQRRGKARDFVTRLNAREIGNGKWSAVYRERFAGMPEAARRRMQGLINIALPNFNQQQQQQLNQSVASAADSLSQSSAADAAQSRRRKRATTCTYSYAFDARSRWPGCAAVINSVRDQSSCGSCWAVATASAFTDRYCIQRAKAGLSTGATNASNFLSDADVLSCTPSSNGCDGGSPYYAWNFLKSTGAVTGTNYTWGSGCKPYPFPPNSNTLFTAPTCASTCTNAKWTTAYSADKRKATWTGYMQGIASTVSKIQAEIQANGTVVASMYVYDDFYYYSSGVYARTNGATYEGGHAIRLLGWGTQTCSDGSSQDFWLGANSWNTDWGQKGFFLIVRGQDEVSIESMGVFYGTPKI